MMKASRAWFSLALSAAVLACGLGAAGASESQGRMDGASARTGQGSASPSPVSIRFRDQSTVDGDRIRLGDVARIIAGEQHAVAELESLEVAKSAGFGLSRMIDTEILFRTLPAALLQALRHRLSTARTSASPPGRPKLSLDSLTRAIGDFVAALPKRPGEVRRWEIARAPDGILVPAGPHTLALSFSGARRKGKVDVNLAIRIGGARAA